MAGPLGVGVEGLVQSGLGAGVAEPGGEVADGGAIVVVEVVADGEDFDDWSAVGSETAEHRVEQTGVQALLEEDVSGKARLHLHSK